MPSSKELTAHLDKLFCVDTTNTFQTLLEGQKLEQFVNTAVKYGLGDVMAFSYSEEQRRELRRLHSAYEIATDDKFMTDVISGAVTGPDEYPFQPVYDSLGRAEGGALDFQPGNEVMHIGTGWPGTAIALHRQFGVAVTCVEIDPVVAQKSAEALEKLGLLGEDKLAVINADGGKIMPGRVTIISAMVPSEDKKTIIGNMYDLTVDLGDYTVVLRTPADRARSLFYQELPEDVQTDWRRVKIGDTAQALNPTDPLRSLVYHVKPRSAIHRGLDDYVMKAEKRLVRV